MNLSANISVHRKKNPGGPPDKRSIVYQHLADFARLGLIFQIFPRLGGWLPPLSPHLVLYGYVSKLTDKIALNIASCYVNILLELFWSNEADTKHLHKNWHGAESACVGICSLCLDSKIITEKVLQYNFEEESYHLITQYEGANYIFITIMKVHILYTF